MSNEAETPVNIFKVKRLLDTIERKEHLHVNKPPPKQHVDFKDPSVQFAIEEVPDLLDKLPVSGIHYDDTPEEGLSGLKEDLIQRLGLRQEGNDRTQGPPKPMNSAMCVGLNESYVEEAIDNSDLSMLYKTTGGVLLGFMLVKIRIDETTREPSSLFISLLCTNKGYTGVGQQLMKIVKIIARANGLERVTLDSVKSAVNFYRKQDFVFADGGTFPMEFVVEVAKNAPVAKGLGGGSRRRRQRIQKRKTLRATY